MSLVVVILSNTPCDIYLVAILLPNIPFYISLVVHPMLEFQLTSLIPSSLASSWEMKGFKVYELESQKILFRRDIIFINLLH